MEWQFSPDDVVRGDVDYGLDAFRRDLLQEFCLNLPNDNPPAEPERLFALVYDMCYWLATGGQFADFEHEIGAGPNLAGFLRTAHRHGAANVSMLGAILQRAIMEQMEVGMGLESALAAVAVRHAQVAAVPVPI